MIQRVKSLLALSLATENQMGGTMPKLIQPTPELFINLEQVTHVLDHTKASGKPRCTIFFVDGKSTSIEDQPATAFLRLLSQLVETKNT
jgi:hypothetical protein